MQQSSSITIFGEVLFDCFPDGSEVLGGAPFNVAWHLQGFGLSPCFISRVGMDAQGEQIRAAMRGWGLDSSSLQLDPIHPTGRVSVRIENGEPHYDIVAGSAYDFIQSADLPQASSTGILYHGSLALRHSCSASALEALKADHQGTIFLDVNLRNPWWSKPTILSLVDDADHVKLNEAELALLGPDLPDDADDGRLTAAMEAFVSSHGLTTLILTLGARGAMLWSEGQVFRVDPVPDTAVVDTVGAGDAFASAMLLGLSCRWPLPVSLEHAGDFAAALVSRRGATINEPAVYQRFLKQWTTN
ncbi:carbohydrate kinase [Synechococcus sp. CCY 9618]|uniref:carbohydrate kinase family protein n=1 Tax=Synechococcus sp. CCY 9618 TaxID=2815602 RepID=UPI001C2193BB|nr:carbohydrate kinase [Synechococcus sp. CCY 9618]